MPEKAPTLETITTSPDRSLRRPSGTEVRRLLETLPAGAYACDAEGRITYYNAQAAKVWGRAPKLNDPADRFCGSFRLYAPDGTRLRHDECWMALALREQREFDGQEIVVERPDGHRVTVLAHASPIHDRSGRLIGAVNVLVDISERKRSERAMAHLADQLAAQLSDVRRLQEMSVRLSTTLELGPILEETLRTAAAIEDADMGVLSLYDETSRELKVGASMGFDLDTLDALARVMTDVSASRICVSERRRVVVLDVELDEGFQELRTVARRAGFRAAHSTPLVTRSGRVLGALCVYFRAPHRPGEREMDLVDLCARQAVDFIENARIYGELREFDRARNEFLATLAHELRNPLAPIRNAVYTLRARGGGLDEARWSMDVIDRQIQHLTRLVDDLLDIARMNGKKLELRKERVDVATVLHAALETSRPILDSFAHKLTVELPDAPVTLDVDLTRLAQIVANLLNNAAKYTDRGGRISLSARRVGGEVVILVRDTGVGIRAEVLPRIFDMFVQGDRAHDRSRGGLGLGLSLVKRLVEMHGGSVSARSDGPGRGSEFEVRLPVAAAPQAAAPRPAADAPDAGQAMVHRRILVVDDNEDAAETLGLLLEELGYMVVTAHDGEGALAAADTFRPDVVLLDIGLPSMSGYEVATAIRASAWSAETVLIATTGWGQDTDRHRSREAGFDYHLVKPIDPGALIGLLASLPAPRRNGTAA